MQFLHPDVYIKLVASQQVVQSGTSPSNLYIMGMTEWGDASKVYPVFDMNAFKNLYGYYGDKTENDYPAIKSLEMFFEEGGKYAWFLRIDPDGSDGTTASAKATVNWNDTNVDIDFNAKYNGDAGNRIQVRAKQKSGSVFTVYVSTAEWTGAVYYEQERIEVDFSDNTSIANFNDVSAYIDIVVNDASGVTAISDSGDLQLSGGSNGVITSTFIGHQLSKFDSVHKVAMIINPHFPYDNEIVTYADNSDDYIHALINIPYSLLTPNDIASDNLLTTIHNSKNENVYYPYGKVKFRNGAINDFPALGAVAGMIARTDNDYNVSEPPAGDTKGQLRSLVGVEYELSSNDIDLFYTTAYVNPIWKDDRWGISVMGVYTQAQDRNWGYIQWRRTMATIKYDLDRLFTWVMFSKINDFTISKFKLQLKTYMSLKWQQGWLGGKTAEESYVLDLSVLTPEMIVAGIFKAKISVLLDGMAEFVDITLEKQIKV